MDNRNYLLQEDPLSPLLFSEPPSKEREHLWESRTTLPFSPFDSMHALSETVIHCPRRGHPIRVRESVYIIYTSFCFSFILPICSPDDRRGKGVSAAKFYRALHMQLGTYHQGVACVQEARERSLFSIFRSSLFISPVCPVPSQPDCLFGYINYSVLIILHAAGLSFPSRHWMLTKARS
jgi:hypothetical protein